MRQLGAAAFGFPVGDHSCMHVGCTYPFGIHMRQGHQACDPLHVADQLINLLLSMTCREQRATDVSVEKCKKRYDIFKAHYGATMRLKQFFPFHLIDSMVCPQFCLFCHKFVCRCVL